LQKENLIRFLLTTRMYRNDTSMEN